MSVIPFFCYISKTKAVDRRHSAASSMCTGFSIFVKSCKALLLYYLNFTERETSFDPYIFTGFDESLRESTDTQPVTLGTDMRAQLS